MTAALRNYQARMRRVLDYVDAHLDEELDLETVARVAAFSKFHFHRQFRATFGLSLHSYVQLARMKRASHRLAHDAGHSVTDIALDAGYDAPDAFARAFRRRFGQSPSSFRKSPDWVPWLAAFGPLDSARSKLMEQRFDYDQISIRTVPDTPVAMLEHRGDRARLGETIERFIAWRKAAGLAPPASRTFTVWRSERTPADPEAYSMDLCASIDRPLAVDDPVMKPGVIPGGRCAVMAVDPASNNHEPAALFLYRDWLPASGEEARDFPIYCERRLTRAPDGSVAQSFAELFLPLK